MVTSRSVILLAILTLSSLIHAKNVDVADIGERYLTPTRDVTTPHIDWINPNAEGALTVLFIARRTCMREVVELAQRLEIKYRFFGVHWANGARFKPGYFRKGYYKGDAPGDKEKRLRKLLDEMKYDLIVFGDVEWKGFPDFARKKILQQVKNGTGLLRVNFRGGVVINTQMKKAEQNTIPVPAEVGMGIPWRLLPAFAEFKGFKDFLGATLAASKFGSGRIIRIQGYGLPWQHFITPGFSPKTMPKYWWNHSQRLSEKYLKERPTFSMPITDVNLLDFDYYLAYIIRAMLFTAGKLPSISIGDEGNIHRVSRSQFTKVSFPVKSKEDISNLTAEFKLRTRDNQVLHTFLKKNISLKKGDNKITFNFDPVPAGKYFADMWIKKNGRIINFGSLSCEVSSPVHIAKIKLDQPSIAIDGHLKGSIKVESEEEKLSGLKLLIVQTDNLGRVVRKKMVETLKNKTLQFELPPITDPKTIFQFLKMKLLKEDKVLDVKQVPFTYQNLYLPDTIQLAVWELPYDSYIAMLRQRQYYKYGFDATGNFWGHSSIKFNYYGVGPGSRWEPGRIEVPLLANLRYISPFHEIVDGGITEYAKFTYMGKDKSEPLVVKPGYRYPSLRERKYLDLTYKLLDDAIKTWRRYSVRDIIFNQEMSFGQFWNRQHDHGELDFSPPGKQYFRDWLKKEYGSLDKLNKEYGSDYQSFSQIEPITLKEAVANPAFGPRWVDFRRAMDSMYTEFLEDLTAKIRKTIPKARTGDYASISHGFRSLDGYDKWKMSRWMRVFEPYPRLTAKIQADFALPDSLVGMGCYWGPVYTRSKTVAGMIPWSKLFRGANFFYSYWGDTQSLMADDFSLYDDVRVRLDQLLEIKHGVGKMLHETVSNDDGIAVLYSMPSIHCWALETAEKVTKPMTRKNTIAWIAMLTDAGYNFRFISYEQLANGKLNQGKFKLLVLPLAVSLCQAECDNIKRFVENGGAVIADLRPGVRNWHGKPYAASPLDDLFNVIQNTKSPRIKNKDIKLACPGASKKFNLGLCQTDESLKAANGSIAPVMISRKYGKGKAILLNFALDGYVRMIGKPVPRFIPEYRTEQAKNITPFVENLLSGKIGMKTVVTFKPELHDLRCYVFDSGKIRYLGLLQELPEYPERYATGAAAPLKESATTVNTGGKAHIYDVRKGRYLGYADAFKTNIRPGVAKVFALMPYRVKSVELQAPAKIKTGGTIAYSITIEADKKPEKHVLRISLLSPSGKEIRHYSGNVNSFTGTYQGKIILALNEKPGKYILVVKDTATGIKAVQNIEICGQDVPKNKK